MKAKQLLKLIKKSGISQASIARKLKVQKSDLNTALKGKRMTQSAIDLLAKVEAHLNSVSGLVRINNEEGD